MDVVYLQCYVGIISQISDRKKAAPGFEPGTPSLRVKCSTTELYRPRNQVAVKTSKKWIFSILLKMYALITAKLGPR